MVLKRIYNHKDFLEAMERGRAELGLTMEEVCEKAGVPDRYYNKVVMGKESARVREVRRQLRGRPEPKGQPSVRYPFKMENSAAWMLQACGLALVVMPLEDALAIVESDPVIELEKRLQARRNASLSV